ncbi:MAG: class I adenylate-forming enzyme family protein [Rhizomicrobium sp.]|jgi:acyl-CoA synthetase (AMP-forming)/AMP-acid ligase II
MADEERARMPALIGDIIPYWAAKSPDRIVLVDDTGSWTYRELDSAINATASWLEQSGVRPGDRVMLVCENCCAAVAVFLALAVCGAWPVIVNARLSDREIDEVREHSGARRIILTTGASARARAHAERLGAVPHDPASFGPVALSPLNEAAIPEPVEADATARVAALLYTSGTTGRPKGVMLSHSNLLFVARASGQVRSLGPEDKTYAVMPISHILGLTGILLGSLLCGAQLRLASRFDPAAVFAALDRDRATVLIGTPSMHAMLVEYATRKRLIPISRPGLRILSSAGAPLDAATKAATEAAFGLTLHNGYGITECSPTITLTSLESPRSDCSVGRLLPGVEARLVGPDGSNAAPDDVGELWVRGPGVMKGYYRAPAETAEAVNAEGWFRTGDLARIEDGNVFIVGRCKELIIRFGFNVYPAEIEGVLNAHPDVARSAVIGRQADGTEDVLAFVHLAAGARATTDDLSDYAATKLAPYKRPSRIVVVPSMPVSPTGKILKSELAAMA